MFDSVLVRRINRRSPTNVVDAGTLAELILFYGQVSIVADLSALRDLLISLGYDLLYELVDRELVRLLYMDEVAAIQTDRMKNSVTRYKPVFVSLLEVGMKEHCRKVLIDKYGSSSKTRRMASRLSHKIHPVKFDEKSVVLNTLEDFSDPDYLSRSVTHVLSMHSSSVPLLHGLKFSLAEEKNGWRVDTNIDFSKLKHNYSLHTEQLPDSISIESILGLLLEVRTDVYLSATLGSDLLTDPVSSALVRFKHEDLLSQITKNVQTIHAFQELVLDEGRSIKDVVNNGERSLWDVIKIIDESQKFRDWLRAIDYDKNLIREYFKSVTHRTWIDKLPGKSFRFAGFTGAGILLDSLGAGGVATASAFALSALDTFLLDKLIKGWRPDQFVDGPLEEFTRKS